jgi:phospholipid N-methyltransferase
MIPDGQRIDALVSGVPLRSLPFKDSEAIVAHWRRLLLSCTTLVQFTYALRGPLRHLSGRFLEHSREIAWLNFPSARVVSMRVVCQYAMSSKHPLYDGTIPSAEQSSACRNIA